MCVFLWPLIYLSVCLCVCASCLSSTEAGSPGSPPGRWRPCTWRSCARRSTCSWPTWRACPCPREATSSCRSWREATTPPSWTWARRTRTPCPSRTWCCPSPWRYSRWPTGCSSLWAKGLQAGGGQQGHTGETSTTWTWFRSTILYLEYSTYIQFYLCVYILGGNIDNMKQDKYS